MPPKQKGIYYGPGPSGISPPRKRQALGASRRKARDAWRESKAFQDYRRFWKFNSQWKSNNPSLFAPPMYKAGNKYILKAKAMRYARMFHRNITMKIAKKRSGWS